MSNREVVKMSKIEFISAQQGLADIEWARPKPAKQFMPQWFKDMPSKIPFNDYAKNNHLHANTPTIRDCPAIPDYFSQGYVIPMWMDSVLTLDKESHNWATSSSSAFPKWEHHPEYQFLDYVKSSNLGNNTDFVFKAVCPWRLVTEPGWSVLQLPLFYNFNKNWTVLPGIIDTDIHHEINQQVLYHKGDDDETIIKAGEGFVLYVPFKREKNKLEIRDANEKDGKKMLGVELEYHAKIAPNGVYKRKQRERDKPKKGFLENLRDRLEE
jgi:hypothetical protein